MSKAHDAALKSTWDGTPSSDENLENEVKHDALVLDFDTISKVGRVGGCATVSRRLNMEVIQASNDR